MFCSTIILRICLQVLVLHYISYLVRILSPRFYAYVWRTQLDLRGKTVYFMGYFSIRDSNTTKPRTYRFSMPISDGPDFGIEKYWRMGIQRMSKSDILGTTSDISSANLLYCRCSGACKVRQRRHEQSVFVRLQAISTVHH